MSFFSPLKYGFLNAKVSALKSFMLKKNDYEILINLESVEEIIERLERTYYRDFLEELSPFLKGSELVEGAALRWLAHLYKKLSRYINEEDRDMLELLRNRHEIKNIKLLLSYRITNKPWEEVKHFLIPISDMNKYRRFYQEESPSRGLRYLELGKEMLSLSFSKLWQGKEEIMKKLLANPEIYVLASVELFYSYMLKNLKAKKAKKIIEILRKEIDIKNLSLMMRFKSEGKSEQEFFTNILAGGMLSLRRLLNAYKNEKEMNALLKDYGVKEQSLSNPSKAEFEMYHKLVNEKKRAFINVLSLEKILGFFFLAEVEVENLKLIARAKEMGIEKERVKSLIIV